MSAADPTHKERLMRQLLQVEVGPINTETPPDDMSKSGSLGKKAPKDKDGSKKG
jgi:hypothetical protein